MSPSLTTLEREEREARLRLQRYRAKVYSARYVDPMTSRLRLNELDRRWRIAAERLVKARSIPRADA